MSIIKIQKDTLSSNADTLKSKVSSASSDFKTLSEGLANIPEHDEFNVTGPAGVLTSSADALKEDLEKLSKNIVNYSSSIEAIDGEALTVENPDASGAADADNVQDTNSWNTLGTPSSGNYSNSGGNRTYSYSTGSNGTRVTKTDGSTFEDKKVDTSSALDGSEYSFDILEKYVDKQKGTTIELPEGLGQEHSVVYWQSVSEDDEDAFKLKKAVGMNFDDDGLAKMGDRYVVCVTSTFGNVGDYIDVVLKDGSIIKCVIGSLIATADNNKWGLNDGKCVVQFMVDKENWSDDKTISSIHPEWDQEIKEITNKGNFFDIIKEPEVVAAITTATEQGARSAIVETAEKELNNTDESKYLEMFGEGEGTLWCSEFVSWCAKKSGYVDAGIIPKFDGAGEGAKWFQDNNRFQDRSYTPKAGDILFTGGDSASHTALVTGVEGDKILVIEGGGNKVNKGSYGLHSSHIYGFGVPDYSKLSSSSDTSSTSDSKGVE